MTRKFMRIMDLAEYLGISEETVRTYIKRYDLPYILIGKRKKLFSKVDIDKWLEKRKKIGW